MWARQQRWHSFQPGLPRRGFGHLAWLGALCCLLPTASHAWPVDVELTLKKGESLLAALTAVEWIEAAETAPAAASAELSNPREILFKGKSAGATLFLLYAEGRVGIWRVVVEEAQGKAQGKPKAPPPPDAALPGALSPLDEAKHACPQLRFQEKLPKISGTVDTEVCRSALLFVLMQPGWRAKELELVFEASVLVAQLAQMQQAVDESLGKGKVHLHYVGATLKMSGKLSPAEHRKALWSVFFHSAGRIALDDSMQVLPPQPETPKEKKL